MEKTVTKRKVKDSFKFNFKDLNPSIIFYFLIGLLLSIFAFIQSKNILVVAIVMFSMIIIYSLNDEKINGAIDQEKLKDAIAFYKSFIYQAALTNSTIQGYKNAVEALPISTYKEESQSFIDNNLEGNLPLFIKDSREEFDLSMHLKMLLDNDDYFDKATLVNFSKKVKFLENNIVEKNTISPLLIATITMSIVVFMFVFQVLKYAL